MSIAEKSAGHADSNGQVLDIRELLAALTAFKKGDFSVRLPVEWTGLAGKVADTFNDVIEQNERMAHELGRLSRVVGIEGKINQRASLGEVTGAWEESVSSVNALVSDLVHPISETARVIGAVAKGDLSQMMALEIDDRPLQGEFLRTAKIVNTHGRSAQFVRLGSDPRGPRSRHRRQTRRPGQGQRRRRHLEGSDGQRESDGRQSDRPGAQHRRP